MKNQNQEKSIGLYLLFFFMFFQSISGLCGGFVLLIAPSGNLLKLPLSVLARSPFSDFFIPGLILFLLLGCFPLGVLYALLARSGLKWLKHINIYSDQKEAWTASLYVGIILVLWIDFQVYFIGYLHYIQTIYALLGVVILILTLLPAVRRYYQIPEERND